MRFVQPVVMLLGVAAYIAFFVTLNAYEDSGKFLWLPFVLVGVWNLGVLVAAVITIVDSVLKVRAGKSRQLATDAMVTKLASIPFFLLNALVLTGSFLVGFTLLLFGGGVLVVAIPIIGVLTYFVMLSTSVYGWAAIVQMRRERLIGIPLTVVYTILLFLPVADTVVGLLLFGRRRPRLALIVGLVAVGVVLIVFGLLGLFGFSAVPVDGLDAFGVTSVIVIVVGFGVIAAMAIVSVVRRSTLRAEAQRATLAAGNSTESDTSEGSAASL